MPRRIDVGRILTQSARATDYKQDSKRQRTYDPLRHSVRLNGYWMAAKYPALVRAVLFERPTRTSRRRHLPSALAVDSYASKY